MAFDEYDDFEQEKLVKDWIKSNWFTIAFGLFLGLGSVFGLNFYKAQQQEQRFEVAKQYKEFSDVMELSEFDEAQNLLSEIEESSGMSFYTLEGHLLLAKEYVGKNELEKAAKELKAVVASKPNQLLTEFAKLRLARVYNAMQKHDEALAQIVGIGTESFLSTAKEIEGDAYTAKGDVEKAKAAFVDAIAKGEGYSGKNNIEIKLENS